MVAENLVYNIGKKWNWGKGVQIWFFQERMGERNTVLGFPRKTYSRPFIAQASLYGTGQTNLGNLLLLYQVVNRSTCSRCHQWQIWSNTFCGRDNSGMSEQQNSILLYNLLSEHPSLPLMCLLRFVEHAELGLLAVRGRHCLALTTNLMWVKRPGHKKNLFQ